MTQVDNLRSRLTFDLVSEPISMAQSLADWSLASTITLNIVHMERGIRKSVERLLLASLDSNAMRVLLHKKQDMYLKKVQVLEISRWSCVNN